MRGLTLIEVLIATLIGATFLVMFYWLFSRLATESSRLDSRVREVELAQEFLLKSVDCDQARTSGVCSDPMPLYDKDSSILIETTGTTRLANHPILARCDGTVIRIQYQDHNNTWRDVLPDNIPACVVNP